jgi:NAD+ kinase
MSKPKLILFADPKRPNATEALEQFLRFARDKAEILANCLEGDCPIDTLRKAEFAIVFGGDGTILGAARQLCETEVPVIGVNVGKLGFLAEFSLKELETLFERIIIDRDLLVERRMVLQCKLLQEGKVVVDAKAVNDVVIAAGFPFNMIELEIEVGGQFLAGCVGDGLIVSTPTGSTAYNLSAGGPILSADLPAVVLTPLCPHSLSFRPIVIDADSKVRIRALRANENTTLLLDGHLRRKLCVDDAVVVEKHPGKFWVVHNPLRTQWDTLATKLKWAEKPRYSDEKEK